MENYSLHPPKHCKACGHTEPNVHFTYKRNVCQGCRAEQDVLRKYGLSKQEYLVLLANQNQRCAICSMVFESAREMVVDHNHLTGDVRGILCKHCNLGLGHFRDDSCVLMAAASYLERTGKKNVCV